MRFRPTRVVHVTSKDELDAALLSADQVIVEGSDQLLSYAVAKASHDPELARVDVQIGDRSISVGRDAAGDGSTRDGDSGVPASRRSDDFGAPPAAARRLTFLVLGLCLAVMTLAAIAAMLYLHSPVTNSVVPSTGSPPPASAGSGREVTTSPAPAPSPSPPPASAGSAIDVPTSPAPPPPRSPPPASSVPEILQSLAWPAVAIAAILALFLVARQAIAGGRNVELSWQVTEKVSGRVVITKVQPRERSGRLAA